MPQTQSPSASVPVIDISAFYGDDAAARAALAAAVDRACTEIGFLVITGHRVGAALRGDWFATLKRFFALSEAEKARYAPQGMVRQGYHRVGSSGLALGEDKETPPDLREYYMLGRLDIDGAYFADPVVADNFHPNVWPDAPEGFRALGEAYYAAVEALARDMMAIFALGLDLPETYFDDKIDRHFSILSNLYYPPQKVAPLPGQLRAGAHTDFGSLTLLLPEPGTGGLQVFTKAGEWEDVPVVPDSFVINIGDMMARWTNDRWVSTLHRVVNEAGATISDKSRQSIAYFLHPNPDAVIACLDTCRDADGGAKYDPVEVGPYIAAKEAKVRKPGAAA